jgi:hypothetical protein
MINEKQGVYGSLVLTVRDEFGNIKSETEVPNTVTALGKAFIAQSMLKTTTNTPVAMTHLGIGTGTPSTTALGVEQGTRVAVTASNVTVTNANDAAQYVATFPINNPAANQSIIEAGIFNASSAGTMLCSTTFTAIAKNTTDTLQITWKVQIT